MSHPKPEVVETQDDLPIVKYLCVCGKETLVNLAGGGQCESCGRRFSAAMILGDPAVTLELSTAHPGMATTVDQQGTATDSAKVGEVFGHYRIINALGRGGMGTVYRALDVSLQRHVALKVIRTPPDNGTNTHHFQRLLQEAIAQARVNHPNIAHIYYVGVEERSPFFAMELVNGPTLTQRLKDGPLTFAEVIDYAQQIVSALAHAAEFDILHGDIKPGNILLSNSSTVKLSDFGLARRLSEISEQAAGIAGTPDYLAPEAVGAGPVDVRSDMYSLGVTLFEMTFGRLPYANSGSSIVDRLRAHQERPVDFPIPWPKHVPQAWQNVLAKLLHKEPSERYASYDALMADLFRLKPVTLHYGGRVPRGMAWFVDLGLVNTTQQILIAPLAVANVSSTPEPMRQLAAAFVSSAILLLVALLQAYWGKTPGKKLFQLRIVDRHGLTPRKSILFARMTVQLLPLWAGILFQVCNALGANYLGRILAGVLLFITLLDAGCALIRKRKRSLHDLLFRTSVVLDTESAAGQPSNALLGP